MEVEFLAAAKESPELRAKFLRLLFTENVLPPSSPPKLSNRELVCALRVTHALQKSLWRPQAQELSEHWKRRFNCVLNLLICSDDYEPWARPLTQSDVTRCRQVIREAAPYWRTDNATLNHELKAIDEVERKSPAARAPRAHLGHPSDDKGTWQILVADRFLKVCNVRNSGATISRALYEFQGKNLQVDSVWKVLKRCRAKCLSESDFEEMADMQLKCAIHLLSSRWQYFSGSTAPARGSTR